MLANLFDLVAVRSCPICVRWLAICLLVLYFHFDGRMRALYMVKSISKRRKRMIRASPPKIKHCGFCGSNESLNRLFSVSPLASAGGPLCTQDSGLGDDTEWPCSNKDQAASITLLAFLFGYKGYVRFESQFFCGSTTTVVSLLMLAVLFF